MPTPISSETGPTRVGRRHLFALVLGGVAAAALLPGRPAFAMSLEEAKKAGVVGERPDGYLGVVAPNADPGVVKLVEDINLQRKAKYRSIATQNGITLPQVEAIAGKRLIDRAERGEFVLTPNGAWSRR